MSPLSNNNNSENSNQQISSNSAFKPLISDSRQHSSIMAASTSAEQQYNSELAYAGYSQINSTAQQEYHQAQQQHQLSLGAFKREHEDITGYTYPRPVKLYDHTMEPYPPNQNGTTTTAFRNDAPSPGASIIDLSTSSVVTSLRTQGFSSAAYFEGQRYDRSPQSASSPHYSSPQMLSPQGQTLDLSVGRTPTMG